MKSTAAAAGVDTGDLTQENVQPQPTENSNIVENQQESIAKLAHELWQHRGCPMGSPEQDWIEAENTLTQQTQR